MNQGILTQLPQPPAMPYGLLGRPTPVPMPAVDYALDVDAADYIQRVQAADGQALELPVRLALDAFIRGCKADGIWNAIKASCILAGARTLSGALIPLVGTAPTNFNFVAADYNRKTGLAGNGSTKYLDSGRSNSADPQNNVHFAVHCSTVQTGATTGVFMAADGRPGAIGTSTMFGATASVFGTRNRSANQAAQAFSPLPGLLGHARSVSTGYLARANLQNFAVPQASEAPESSNVLIFRRGGDSTLYGSHRLSFYSIGEALDLALLDACVTQLMNALAVVL